MKSKVMHNDKDQSELPSERIRLEHCIARKQMELTQVQFHYEQALLAKVPKTVADLFNNMMEVKKDLEHLEYQLCQLDAANNNCEEINSAVRTAKLSLGGGLKESSLNKADATDSRKIGNINRIMNDEKFPSANEKRKALRKMGMIVQKEFYPK